MNTIKILTQAGIIDAKHQARVKEYAKEKNMALPQAVVALEMAPKDKVYATLAESIGVPFVDLASYLVSPDCLKLISSETANRYHAVPLFAIKNTLTVAMEDPTNLAAVDRIRHESGKEVEVCLGTSEDIRSVLDQHYGASKSISKLLATLDVEERGRVRKEVTQKPSAEAVIAQPAADQPVVRLVNLIIEQAVEQGASDIHIEPEEKELGIRFRIDGVLHPASAPPKHYESALVSRLKVMANLDIAETRIPQDGRMKMDIKGRSIDIRVSIIPTVNGENVVLRLLGTNVVILDLKHLGFSEEIRLQFEELLKRSYGMLLETGPTGSGKTTTLYAALSAINTVERNIVTIEDPVEYKLPLIRQIQINPKANLTFVNGLRSIVRQDPDVIMVGEIRDAETAHIAIQSALTGHLVFSTLHTQNAAGAVTRLVEMGVEPFLVSSSLIGVVAQRLVRCICTTCKQKAEPPKALKTLFPDGTKLPDTFYQGKGCLHCNKTGFKGRIGIFELLLITESIQQLIVSKATASVIYEKAQQAGMKTLREDGLEKVRAGVTTVEEILKAI